MAFEQGILTMMEKDVPDNSTKRQIARMIAKLDKIKTKIAANRDALREAIDEYEDILQTCDDAADSLNGAIERLSEQI